MLNLSIVSYFNYRPLKWPGIVGNSTAERKRIYVHSFYQTLVFVFTKKQGQKYMTVYKVGYNEVNFYSI